MYIIIIVRDLEIFRVRPRQNRGFTMKTPFSSVHTVTLRRGDFKPNQLPVIIVANFFLKKLRCQSVFRPHER